MSLETSKGLTAQKLKQDNIAEVQWENRVDALKNTHENLARQNQALTDEINRKRADFDNYISAKDSDYKKNHESVVAEREQLSSQREEFMKILKQHEIDKSNHAQNVKELEIEKNKVTEARARVDGFVIACQRAYSLIG